jgi:mannosyltransferase
MNTPDNTISLISDNIIFSLQKAGGISALWSELLKRLLDDPEISLQVIESGNQNIFRKDLTIDPSIVLRDPASGFPLLVQRLLNPKIRAKGIFHSSYYRTAGHPGLKNITTVHDFIFEYYWHGLYRFVHHAQKSRAINKSARIICVSENTKADLLKFYPGIDESLVRVIFNGVSDIYRPVKVSGNDADRLVPFASREFVLYVGDRNSPHKNFRTAVKACRIAKVPLVIVGRSLKKGESGLLADLLGKSNFKHLGHISPGQLNSIYNQSLCLVYPSKYEGFGIPVVEAQKAGCPVISTNCSSIPEVAGNGAVLLEEVSEYSLADAIRSVMLRPGLFRELQDEGYKNAKRFSWDLCYSQTKQVYREVFEE